MFKNIFYRLLQSFEWKAKRPVPFKVMDFYNKKAKLWITLQPWSIKGHTMFLMSYDSSNLSLQVSKEKPDAWLRKLGPENFEKSWIFSETFFTSKAPGLLVFIMIDKKVIQKYEHIGIHLRPNIIHVFICWWFPINFNL